MRAIGTENAATGRRGARGGSLAKRLLAALVFIPCLIVIANRGGVYYLALIVLFIFLGLREFYSIMRIKGLRPHVLIGIACGTALPLYLYYGGVHMDAVLTAALGLVLVAELLRRNGRHAADHIAATIFGVLYVSWLGSHLALIRMLPLRAGHEDRVGFALVIALFTMTWCCDTGAYAAGKLFGRRKLFPSISPGKTVEGAVGGVVFSAAGILIARQVVEIPVTAMQAVVLAVAVAVAGQVGDLFESLIKRDAGIKDSSGAIPGHGGILDRMDSLLFTAPLVYYVSAYFLLKG